MKSLIKYEQNEFKERVTTYPGNDTKLHRV